MPWRDWGNPLKTSIRLVDVSPERSNRARPEYKPKMVPVDQPVQWIDLLTRFLSVKNAAVRCWYRPYVACRWTPARRPPCWIHSWAASSPPCPPPRHCGHSPECTVSLLQTKLWIYSSLGSHSLETKSWTLAVLLARVVSLHLGWAHTYLAKLL
jgi:hypothetical protein